MTENIRKEMTTMTTADDFGALNALTDALGSEKRQASLREVRAVQAQLDLDGLASALEDLRAVVAVERRGLEPDAA